MRLTKKRLRELDMALTLDDVLYERFRRLNDELSRREERLRRKSSIAQVIQKRGKMNYVLQILEVHPTEDGTIVVCR